jgi:lactoylglutathione lyase
MRFHHVGVSVSDLERSLAWYGEVLGFKPGYAFEVPQAGLRGRFAVNEDGVSIELIEKSGARPGALLSEDGRPNPIVANGVLGYNHFALAVSDLDGTYARIIAAGGREVWDPRPSPEPGVRMAYLADPDGNLVELIEKEF